MLERRKSGPLQAHMVATTVSQSPFGLIRLCKDGTCLLSFEPYRRFNELTRKQTCGSNLAMIGTSYD